MDVLTSPALRKQIYNRWRGFQPWPGAYTTLRGKKLIVHRLKPEPNGGVAPGALRVDAEQIVAGCGDGTAILLEEVQLEGKRRMGAAEFPARFPAAHGRKAGRMKRGRPGSPHRPANSGGPRRSDPQRPAPSGAGGKGGESPRPPAAPITPSRRAAFDVLMLVGAGKGHSDDLLHSAAVDALSPEDRNLATALVMGVLRWQIALDARIAALLARPDQRLAERVAIALRLGAFQLLYMDRIPAHAALSESVELCRAAGEPHTAGMVNAILRRISTAARPGEPIFESPGKFAERLSHPRWLVERWAAEYGRDTALAICEYDQREPQSGGLFPAAAEPTGDTGPTLPQIDDGSRLVAELACAAAPTGTSDPLRVWDCCAAPGGKTLVLAARLPAAEILATDISKRRLEQFQRRLAGYPYGTRIQTGAADAATGTGSRGCVGHLRSDSL